MRIAVISDIHGNQLALEAVLRDLEEQPRCDELVIAGDLCLNGPRPREVLRIIQELHCPVIQGNVDLETVTQAPEKGEKKRSVIGWTREQIGQDGIAYLAALPFSYRVEHPLMPLESLNTSEQTAGSPFPSLDQQEGRRVSGAQVAKKNPAGRDLLIVHANPLNMEEAIFPNADDAALENLLGGLDARIGALTFGHLHIAYTRRWRNLLLTDVASCGLPRDEDLRAAYGILTWQGERWEAEIRRVPYDVQAVARQIESCGMPHVKKRIKVLLEARY